MAGHEELCNYDDSVLEDDHLPRTTTLEDYVRYKPARRKKGESPRRTQDATAAAREQSRSLTGNDWKVENNPQSSYDAESGSKNDYNTAKNQPKKGVPHKLPEVDVDLLTGSTHDNGRLDDHVRSDGDFKYQPFSDGKCMILQWQAATMSWASLGVVNQSEAEVFLQVEKTWHEYPQYVLSNGQFDKNRFRAHIEFAIRKIVRGVKARHGFPEPLTASSPKPAHQTQSKSGLPGRLTDGCKLPSESLCPRVSATPARSSTQHGCAQPATPIGSRSYSGSATVLHSAPCTHTDPFVSSVDSTTSSSNPSERWMREHQQWRDQENQRIGVSVQYKQHGELEASHNNPKATSDSSNGQAFSTPSPSSTFYPQLTSNTTLKTVPQRDELRRTVLHDPYRQANLTASMRPSAKPAIAIEDIPSLWPSSGGYTMGYSVPFPKPLNKINPLPPPIRTANPWASETFKIGRTTMPASLLGSPVKPAVVAGVNQHPREKDNGAFPSPSGSRATPATITSASPYNAVAVVGISGAASNMKASSSYQTHEECEHALQAVAQRQTEYEDRLDAFWTSGQRKIPMLRKRVRHALARHNTNLSMDPGNEEVKAHDEMILWTMLHAQLEAYAIQSDRQSHNKYGGIDTEDLMHHVGPFFVQRSRFFSPAMTDGKSNDESVSTALIHSNSVLEARMEHEVNENQEYNDISSIKEGTSDGYPRVVLPGTVKPTAPMAA